MMQESKLYLPIEYYKINGIIHVGANIGQYAKYYHQLGVAQVIWIEQYGHLDKELYLNTSKFGMRQLYYNARLSDVDNIDDGNCMRFKTLWRQQAHDIDIETYDMLHVATSTDMQKIVEGFDNFKSNFRIVVISNDPDQTCKTYMDSIGYTLDEFNDFNQGLYVK